MRTYRKWMLTILVGLLGLLFGQHEPMVETAWASYLITFGHPWLVAGECRCDTVAVVDLGPGSPLKEIKEVKDAKLRFSGNPPPGTIEVVEIEIDNANHRIIFRLCVTVNAGTNPGEYTVRGTMVLVTPGGASTSLEIEVRGTIVIRPPDSPGAPGVGAGGQGGGKCPPPVPRSDPPPPPSSQPPPPACGICQIWGATVNVIPLGIVDESQNPPIKGLFSWVIVKIQTVGYGTAQGSIVGINTAGVTIHEREPGSGSKTLGVAAPFLQGIGKDFAGRNVPYSKLGYGPEPCWGIHTLWFLVNELRLQPPDAPEVKRLADFLRNEIPASWQVAPGEYRASYSLSFRFVAEVWNLPPPCPPGAQIRFGDVDYVRSEFRLVADSQGRIGIKQPIPGVVVHMRF